jgi:hypothetical protein
VCTWPTDHTPTSAKVSPFSFREKDTVPTFPIFQDPPGYWIYPLAYVPEQHQRVTTNDCHIWFYRYLITASVDVDHEINPGFLVWKITNQVMTEDKAKATNKDQQSKFKMTNKIKVDTKSRV